MIFDATIKNILNEKLAELEKNFGASGFPVDKLKDSMVIQGGNDHARHRALSIPVGLEVAVEREPCGVEREGAVC